MELSIAPDIRMENLYTITEDGTFSDGEPAFRLTVKQDFIIHGKKLISGTTSKFRIDQDSELRYSWMFGEGDIRKSQLNAVILGSNKDKGNNIVEESYLSSCVIKASRVAIKRVEFNAVNSKSIEFFGALGDTGKLYLSKINYVSSVRMYNGSYSDFLAFTKV